MTVLLALLFVCWLFNKPTSDKRIYDLYYMRNWDANQRE